MMSFNLNKSDSDPNDHQAQPASKGTSFDLSKSDAITDEPKAKKPAYWLYALAAIVVVGVAALLLTNRDAAGRKAATDSALTGAAATDTMAAAGSPSADSSHKQATVATGQLADSSATAQGTPANPIPDKALSSAGKPGKGQVPASPLTGGEVKDNSAPVFAASFKAGAVTPRSTANSITDAIRKKFKAYGKVQVSVFGYASSEGDPALNETISQARADAYKKMLIQKGIAESSITATGRGIENPIASNDTESGRRKNRRVEVSF